MKLQSLFAPLFISAVIAADANSVANKIKVITANTNTLNKDINAYITSGLFGIPQALQIQVDSINIFTALNDVINEANASDNFGDAGSRTVLDAVKPLASTTQSTLKNLQTKTGLFADLGPLVRASLYQLRGTATQFTAALAGKLDTDYITEGLTYYQQVDDAFKAAIVAYGGKAVDL